MAFEPMVSRPQVGQETSSSPAGLAAGLLIWLFLAAAAVFSVVAVRRWWLPPVASAEGAEIDQRLMIVLGVIGVVFLATHLVLGLFLIRFRDRGAGQASHIHENGRLEVTWTVGTAAVLLVLTLLAGSLWLRVSGAAPAQAQTVQVLGVQFGWYFQYPGADATFGPLQPFTGRGNNPMGLDRSAPGGADDIVAQELHVVKGRPVRLRITSRDVIHSLYIPNFRFKKDAVPGRVTEIWFTPTEAGTFPIACAELCGAGHFVMASKVVVHESQAELEAWLQARAPR